MNWVKKNWSNVLFVVVIVLLVLPQTSLPIKTFVSRITATSPNTESEIEREVLTDYQWNLKDLNCGEADFSKFKGKKILINFWATWCPPCVADMPSMQELYNDYKDNVVFVFVTNEKEPAVNKFITKYGYTFPIYKAISPTPELLRTNNLPTTYLLNEAGEILINKTGAADWNSDNVRALME
ncbi:TlpA family protein disulfide reductase [Bacteroidia bacterium]|nr:TlpA family protein disulfide reductase [Bacteroidia bacterium]